MTVVRPNSIAGINSITAQTDSIDFFKSDGTQLAVLSVNVNASSGVSTVANLNVTGISTLGSSNGIGTVTIGIGTTALLVEGNARVTGILTVGTASITIDGTNNEVSVGTGVTIHHINGVQVGPNTLHSTGFTVNNLNATGVTTVTQLYEGTNRVATSGKAIAMALIFG